MSDLLVIVVTAAFFRLCLGYVRLCDRVIGPDLEGTATVVSQHQPVAGGHARRDAEVQA